MCILLVQSILTDKAGLEEKKGGRRAFSEKIRRAKTFFNYKKEGENFFQLNKGERSLLFEKKRETKTLFD